MTEIPPPPLPPALPAPGSPDHGRTKLALNLVAAGISTLLALWMAVADFNYPGNLLFQDSASIVLAGLYLSALFLVVLVLAAVPKRIIVAANLLILSRIAMGWPLSLVIDHNLACRIVSLGLLVLCLYHLAASLRPRLLQLHLRPWLRLRHSAAAVLLWLGTGILSIPTLLLGYVEAGKSLMGDYVQISWGGVSLVERVFEKDGRRVHLVGMMHIGNDSFYTTLNERMRTPPADGRRIVLTEGVTDEQDILPAGFKSGQTYAKLARALGLSVQPHSGPAELPGGEGGRPGSGEVAGVSFQNADIDISALDRQHQQTLVTVLEMLDVDKLSALLLAQPEGVTGRDIERLFVDGLLGRRNDSLMARFDESVPDYQEIFIPWGAAHLPDIEQRLLARGYSRQDETISPVVRFRGKTAPAAAVSPAG